MNVGYLGFTLTVVLASSWTPPQEFKPVLETLKDNSNFQEKALARLKHHKTIGNKNVRILNEYYKDGQLVSQEWTTMEHVPSESDSLSEQSNEETKSLEATPNPRDSRYDELNLPSIIMDHPVVKKIGARKSSWHRNPYSELRIRPQVPDEIEAYDIVQDLIRTETWIYVMIILAVIYLLNFTKIFTL